jgi:hypothetical protein
MRFAIPFGFAIGLVVGALALAFCAPLWAAAPVALVIGGGLGAIVASEFNSEAGREVSPPPPPCW